MNATLRSEAEQRHAARRIRNERRLVFMLARDCMNALGDMAYWDKCGWPAHITRASREARATRCAEGAFHAALRARNAAAYAQRMAA